MYDLVADIERYPEFLPWCIAARNRKREDSADGEVVWSDLVVGFKLVRERFTSKVNLIPAKDGAPARIDVEYVRRTAQVSAQPLGLHARRGWRAAMSIFTSSSSFGTSCSKKLIGSLFQEAVTRMVGAVRKTCGPIIRAGKTALAIRLVVATNRFDFVAVGIQHKGSVIGGGVFRSQTGGTGIPATIVHGGFVEVSNGSAILRQKCKMGAIVWCH